MVQLAQQFSHPLNVDVVSAERMSMVSLEARMSDQAGLRRLFREISDPGRMTAFDKAIGFLEKENIPWQEMYIDTATPGQQYSAVVALRSPEVTVARAGGQNTASHSTPPEQDGGEPARTRQIGLEL